MSDLDSVEPIVQEMPERLLKHLAAHPEHADLVDALWFPSPFPVDQEWLDDNAEVPDYMLAAIEPVVRDIVVRLPIPFFSPMPPGPFSQECLDGFLIEAFQTSFAVRLFLRGWEAIRPWEPFGPFQGMVDYCLDLSPWLVEQDMFLSCCLVQTHGPAGKRMARQSFVKSFGEWTEKVDASEALLRTVPRDMSVVHPNWRSEPCDSQVRPQFKLPAFLDLGWVSKNVALSGSMKSRIAAVAGELSASCLDAAIPGRFGKSDYGSMIFALFHEPFALNALSELSGKEEWPRQRSVFRRFYAEMEVKAGIKSMDVGKVHDRYLLIKLVRSGHVEDAKRFAAIRGSELLDEDFIDVLLAFPEVDSEEVGMFLGHRRLLKSWTETNHPDLVATVAARNLAPLGDRIPDLNYQGLLVKNPASDSSVSTPLEAYRAALLSLSTSAAGFADIEPSADAVAQLRALVDGLPALVENYVASLPKRVDAAPILARTGAVRETIIGLAQRVNDEVDLPEVPSLLDLSEGGAGAIISQLDVTESHVETVRVHAVRLEGLFTSLPTAKLASMAQITSDIQETTTLVTGELQATTASYRAVTDMLNSDRDAVAPVAVVDLPSAPKGKGSVVQDLADLDFSPDNLTVEQIDQELATGLAAAGQSEPAEQQPSDIAEAAVEVPGVEIADADDAAVQTVEQVAEVTAEDAFISDFLESLKSPEDHGELTSDEPEVDDVEFDANDIAAISTLTVEQPVVIEDIAAADPYVERVDGRIWDFIGADRIGLGYHLAAAAVHLHGGETIDVTPAELRFAAMSNAMNHASIMARPEIATDAVAQLYSVEGGLPTADDDLSVARRFLLYPAAIEMAVFHPDSGAEQVLVQLNGLGEQVTSAAHALTASVQKIARMRLQLTPALLGHIGNAIDAKSGAAATRNELIEKIQQFQRAGFNFGLAGKVRYQLLQPNAPLGKLRDALGSDDARALAACKSYVEQYSGRSNIIDMLRESEMATNGRIQGIDGAARDRLLVMLTDIADIAALYKESREAQDVISDERPKITQAAAELVSHLTAARVAFEAAASSNDGTLSGIAAQFVANRFVGLEALLSGNAASVPSYGVAMALHGDLPLLPQLHFGSSWYPSPYEPSEIVSALLEAPVDIMPRQGADAAFEAIYRRRVSEGSFVGARMMVEMGSRYGISESLRQRLVDQLDVDVDAAKEALAKSVEATRNTVERVIRFGSIDRPDDANRHMSTVGRVESAAVPVDVALEHRIDVVGDERIEDVRLARHLLAEVNQEIGLLLEEPRKRLMGEIDAVVGKVSADDIAHLRQLCESDDLLSASEFLQVARETGAIPTSVSRNQRFDRFSKVLPTLATEKSIAEKAAGAIAERSAFCGLAYDGLSEGRAEDAGETMTAWRSIFRNIGNVRSDNSFPSRVAALLGRLGMADAKLIEEHGQTSAQRKRYVGDFSFKVALDAEQLLLPEFGSLTDGRYRICLTATMPANGDIDELLRTSGKYGVVLLVNEVISPEAREKFLQDNLKGQRRVALIDMASVLFSLAEPAQRPLTLFELAQPYSYAAPYRDWEREEVPVELFVGRANELASLYDMNGSCIVFGGRRLGKTSVLQHLKSRFNAPGDGILVGYLDAQGIGQGQSLTKLIWAGISRQLPSIFKTVISEQSKVVDGIQAWLAADPRRRIVMLIDEADDFVAADAAQGYPELLALQRLMTESRRRFKFVIAGLHNVGRAAQTGNDPIKHISSSPVCIGALMGKELADAEALVIRPFAALGMEFENRSDVWRILSHANYYPVLTTTYCKHLWILIVEEVRRTQTSMRVIPSSLVAKIFEDHQSAMEEVKDKFLLTLRIDQRYELIAYAVASLVLDDQESGKLEEGVTITQIREAANAFWTAGFAGAPVSLYEQLTIEMVGLGILRRTPENNWTLRSQAVLRLLGTSEQIDEILLDFSEREAPGQFDPKSGRRLIDLQNEEVIASPLTLSQERDVLTDSHKIKVIFGTEAGGVDFIPKALETAGSSFSDTDSQNVHPAAPRSKVDMLERLAKLKPATGSSSPAVLVIHANADWEPDWISSALRARPVINGSARVVFVGRPKHLERVVGSPASIRSSDVRLFSVEPWSPAFVGERVLNRFANMDADTRAAIGVGTGYWNRPMSAILLASNNWKVKTRLDRAMAEYASPEAYGLGKELASICEMIKGTLEGRFTMEDLKDLMGFDELQGKLSGIWQDPTSVSLYGQILGVFVNDGERDGQPVYKLANPIPALKLVA